MNKKSIVGRFLRLRPEIRLHQELLDNSGDTRITMLRLARKLDAGSPFDQARAAIYRARHAAMGELWSRALERRRELGRELLAMAPQFDAATAYEQRLELLNVNVADRADISRGAGLVLIVAGYCREDSAARRRDDYCDGPLFNSVHLEIIITMSSTAESRAAVDKVMVDVFGAKAYSMFGQKPDLQLVGGTAATPPGATR